MCSTPRLPLPDPLHSTLFATDHIYHWHRIPRTRVAHTYSLNRVFFLVFGGLGVFASPCPPIGPPTSPDFLSHRFLPVFCPTVFLVRFFLLRFLIFNTTLPKLTVSNVVFYLFSSVCDHPVSVPLLCFEMRTPCLFGHSFPISIFRSPFTSKLNAFCCMCILCPIPFLISSNFPNLLEHLHYRHRAYIFTQVCGPDHLMSCTPKAFDMWVNTYVALIRGWLLFGFRGLERVQMDVISKSSQ